MGNAPLTLSELNRLITSAIAGTPALRDVWVVAELSQVSGSKGTHWYMDLLEKDAAGRNVARMKGMIWQQNVRPVNMKLYEATGVYFQSGIKVMVRGQVSFHPSHGMGFAISDVEPSYTIGDMERLRREILETLKKEGLAELNKKLPLPIAPQNVAVISAEGAAGYGDFVHQLSSTPEGLVFYPVLFPARLQGEKTAESVISALNLIERHADKWDLVVIIRGGGAASDLNAFDNLELARRIALCPLPIMVGIGHERDRTVLDEIVRVRCKTPTAVASTLIDMLRSAYGTASELTSTAARIATDRLTGERRRLDNLTALVPIIAMDKLKEARELLSRTTLNLPAAASRASYEARLRLERLRSGLENAFSSRMSSEMQNLDRFARMLSLSAPVILERARQQSAHLERMIAALDPASTLKRGYSITRINGHAVKSANEASAGTVITTTLSEGTLTSTVG